MKMTTMNMVISMDMTTGGDHEDHRDHDLGHAHTHRIVDPSVLTTNKGIWAVKWSLLVCLSPQSFR
jgi:hypothetical protein